MKKDKKDKKKEPSFKDINTMQSTRISDEILNFYKQIAEDRGMTLTEVLGRVIKWYIKNREGKKYHYYLISSSNEKYKSVWIETGVLNLGQKLAEKDGVSNNNVLFSAFVTFFHEAKLMDMNNEIEMMENPLRYI